MTNGMAPTVRGAAGGFGSLLLVVLWSQVLLLAVLGLVAGADLSTVALTAAALVAMAITATLLRSAAASALAVSIALIACAVVFVATTGGAAVSHLYFVVVLAAVALYRDWRPLALAAGLTVFYHLGVAAFSDRWTMTSMVVFSAFIIALTVLLMLGWQTRSRASSDQTSLDRYRLSFEAAPIGMAVMKPSGEFIQVNRALADLLGEDAGDFPGTNIRRVVHSDDMSEVGEAWEHIGGETTHSADLWVRVMTSQGQSIWSRMSLSLVPWTPEHPAMVVMQLEDLSGAHDEKSRLEDLVAGKDRFVAAVGDEIRRSLGPVIDLTSEGDLKEAQQRTREAVAIVEDLVVSARSGSGVERAMGLPIDTGALCSDVISLVPDSEDVTLEVAAQSVWGDPTLIRQILYGLVSNAVRYGGPNVSVKVAHSGPDTVIQVSEDGPAIPEPDRERIFNSDLRNGKPATRPAAVGLSLTVGRHLARQMDGDLTYRRSASGRNVYELRLPSEELGSEYAPDASGVDIPA